MTADELFNSLISHCSPTVFWRGFCKENIDVKAWVLFDEVHHWVEFLFLKQSVINVFLRAYVCRLDSNVYLSVCHHVLHLVTVLYIILYTPGTRIYFLWCLKKILSCKVKTTLVPLMTLSIYTVCMSSKTNYFKVPFFFSTATAL